MMTPKEKLAVQVIAVAALDAIAASGDQGAPSGLLYAGMAGKVGLSQYQQIMGQMEGKGFIKQEFDCYTITAAGKDFLAKLNAKLAAA